MSNFLDWYSSLELREVSEELLIVCSNTHSCSDCILREKCPTRAIFYMPDKSFELLLQTAEVSTQDELTALCITSLDAENLSFISTEKLRKKRKEELFLNPEYSLE